MSGRIKRRLRAALFAFANFESGVAHRIEKRSLRTLHDRARRLLFREPAQEIVERRARAFHFDEDALRRIRNPAGQA